MAFFVTASKKLSEFLVLWLNLLQSWLIGNRTSCRPIRSVITLVIKQIGLPLLGRPILLITRMTTQSCYHYKQPEENVMR